MNLDCHFIVLPFAWNKPLERGDLDYSNLKGVISGTA
jgi:hypothetical protein